MSAPSFSTDPATVQAAAANSSQQQQQQQKLTGAQLAKDFQENFGRQSQPQQKQQQQQQQQQAAPEVGGHFNRITKRWERDDEYVVDTTQDASTMPGDESTSSGNGKKGFSLKKVSVHGHVHIAQGVLIDSHLLYTA
ncbi:hypothetical protein ACM66B_003462 [Microbotryomycetes sp. NB124-2]